MCNLTLLLSILNTAHLPFRRFCCYLPQCAFHGGYWTLQYGRCSTVSPPHAPFWTSLISCVWSNDVMIILFCSPVVYMQRGVSNQWVSFLSSSKLSGAQVLEPCTTLCCISSSLKRDVLGQWCVFFFFYFKCLIQSDVRGPEVRPVSTGLVLAFIPAT